MTEFPCRSAVTFNNLVDAEKDEYENKKSAGDAEGEGEDLGMILADVFITLSPFMKVYRHYCENYNRSLRYVTPSDHRTLQCLNDLFSSTLFVIE